MTTQDIENEVENGNQPMIETRSAAVVGDVDTSQRIITIVAVPYEQPTLVPFQRGVWNEVFSRSAFRGMENSTRRIPVTACMKIPAQDHSGGELVGRATQFYPERSEGLVADLKISRTPQGDNTLELARDGALYPSVGFMVKNRLDEQLDRGSMTRRIGRAFLDHIAFVGQPAYPGAKVLAMRSNGGSQDGVLAITPLMDEFLNDELFQRMLNLRNT